MLRINPGYFTKLAVQFAPVTSDQATLRLFIQIIMLELDACIRQLLYLQAAANSDPLRIRGLALEQLELLRSLKGMMNAYVATDPELAAKWRYGLFDIQLQELLWQLGIEPADRRAKE